jgi:hypothetical protein
LKNKFIRLLSYVPGGQSSPLPQGLPRIVYLMVLPFKLLIQTLSLIWILVVRVPAPDFFLVQVRVLEKYFSWFQFLDFEQTSLYI